MGQMYAWATKDYCLDELSLPQLIKYYQKGWETKQTEARVTWGTLGTLLNGDKQEPGEVEAFAGKPNIEEIRRCYPGYENAYIDAKGRLVKG
jgi:hypothetical protein